MAVGPRFYRKTHTMPAARYARPRLIAWDDKRYRAYVQQFILQRQNQKAMRPPRQRDLFGGEAEIALRGWLAGHYALSEWRILEYEERRGRNASTKYRELDALLIQDRQASVFEIKASRTAGALRRAVGQLRETREILRLLYPQVYATVLLVDTGIPTAEEVAAMMAVDDAPPRPPQTLDEVLESLPEVHLIASLDQATGDTAGVDLLRFSVNDIIALVGAENLSLDWEADELEPEEAPELPPASATIYSTANDEDEADDNPFAAALRKAGMKEGQ